MNLLRPITIFIAITVSSCMFSFALAVDTDGKSTTVKITEDYITYSIGYKVNSGEFHSHEKMKDTSELLTNLDTSDYRFWYVHDNDSDNIHTDCNRVESRGRIFPGEETDGSYDKDYNYTLYGTGNSNYNNGSTTVCIKYVGDDDTIAVWTWLGSWRPAVHDNSSYETEIEKLEIYDVAEPTTADD